ncbi:Alpha/Beta hydrolase protein [Mycena albidolilacea]|uniref:Alpha/Beta hydrolase protein n=1 Tax=Mycena albidolilacea TaxID=1033008 RepID=A0AAD7F4Z2_9AGAR|nr:Alpha/Beta hydrolase protein [Mycena albidolilacea]
MFFPLKWWSLVLAVTSASSAFDVKPFRIDLGAKIPRLNSVVKNTRLPAKDLYPGVGSDKISDKGISLESLRGLRTDWLENFDWETQQAELNRLNHYTVVIDSQTVHFVHQKSRDPDAVPVILLHGWPGSFHEFSPIVESLTQSWTNGTGKNVSFNVVVPSLPGFVFSPAPPANWTVNDTARIFNTLMTEVLGYPTYALHATDWGSVIGYSLYSSFNTTVRAAHFVMIPFLPPSGEQLAADNITLSDDQNVALERSIDWLTLNGGYNTEQSTKPNDIGLAMYDSPVGQLTWIAAMIKLASDPRAGTPPSVLNNTAILTSVSLYYLTDSFLSSVWIYAQNTNAFNTVYEKPPTNAPLVFSFFKYNPGFWPKEYVAKVGNLVSYKVHDFGGHFAGLDNPPALLEDIREMGFYFKA